MDAFWWGFLVGVAFVLAVKVFLGMRNYLPKV